MIELWLPFLLEAGSRRYFNRQNFQILQRITPLAEREHPTKMKKLRSEVANLF